MNEQTSHTSDLPERFPGLSESAARELVRQVRAYGTAAFTYGGKTYQLAPSKIEGSQAIWATKRCNTCNAMLRHSDPDICEKCDLHS